MIGKKEEFIFLIIIKYTSSKNKEELKERYAFLWLGNWFHKKMYKSEASLSLKLKLLTYIFIKENTIPVSDCRFSLWAESGFIAPGSSIVIYFLLYFYIYLIFVVINYTMLN